MSAPEQECGGTTPRPTRRQALVGAGLAAATAALVPAVAGASTREPFYGRHQSGVATPIQDHLAFGVFDVTTASTATLRELLATWTAAAGRMVEGREVDDLAVASLPAGDTGEAAGLGAASLTVTFGFGPSLFDERFGLAGRRPAALIDLPAFPGDALVPTFTGGDLCVQACADDPIVAFHAVRNLARLGTGVVSLRYVQIGVGATSTSARDAATPRNLLGFKDGTDNVRADDPAAMASHVWVADSDQSWMNGGTYLVARRIRIHLEEWSSLPLGVQEDVIGRYRGSGAPLGERREHAPLELTAFGAHGQLRIPTTAHVRVASPQVNQGAQILRRGFNFTDGLDPVTGELDAGLMFLCFQRDPGRQFVTIQTNLAASDALSRYTAHTGSGIFAVPPGARRGRSVGHELFS